MKLFLALILSSTMAFAVAAADHTVTVGNNFFSPRDLTIEAGDTVTWTNNSGGIHNVHADDESFRCARGCDATGGNGAPSAERWSVTLTFGAPGTTGYFCDFHGAKGGIGMAGTITVEEDEIPFPEETHVVVLPIAGSVQGASFFRTNARFFNPSPSDSIDIAASYLRVGQSNESPGTTIVSLDPLQTVIYKDVVGTLLGESGLGAIRLHSGSRFAATSRIFTDSSCADPAGGTFGQFVPGVDEADALMSGAVLHLSFNDEFRANVGGVNTATTANRLLLTLHGPSGVIGAPITIDLGPRAAFGPTSLPALFALSNLNEENLWMSFTSQTAVIMYGSVVDNATSDQIFVVAISDEISSSSGLDR